MMPDRNRDDDRAFSKKGERFAFALMLMGAVVVFGFRLENGGLINTEGHRVIPAWEMLDSGDILVPRMFGQIYVRKPPGFLWSLAASAALFGKTEFAARLVGALAGVGMVVAAYFFARRWFGSKAAIAAGWGQLSLPLFWKFQRSAEIEGLHNLAAQLSILLLIDLLARPHASRTSQIIRGLLFGLAIVASLVIKGPATLPCLVGILLAVVVLDRSPRALLSKPMAGGIVLSAFLGGLFYAAMYWRVEGLQEPIVAEQVEKFLWNGATVFGMLALVPNTLAHTLPHSLLVLVPWLCRMPADPRAKRTAQLVALGAIGGILSYAVLGITNPRYAMPAITPLPVLMSFMLASWREEHVRQERLGVPWWRTIPAPSSIGLALAAFWVSFVFLLEPTQRRTSGREEGEQWGRMLPDGAEIWADSLVEARPEVLIYAQETAKRLGKRIVIHWKKPLTIESMNALRAYVALREDDGELESFRSNLPEPSWMRAVHEGKVYKFPYVLAQVASENVGRDRLARRETRTLSPNE